MSDKTLKMLKGTVVSNKMDKSCVVRIDRKVKHPLIGKIMRKSTKLHVHDADNVCSIGDVVLIQESKPISKLKSWKLVEVLEKAS